MARAKRQARRSARKTRRVARRFARRTRRTGRRIARKTRRIAARVHAVSAAQDEKSHWQSGSSFAVGRGLGREAFPARKRRARLIAIPAMPITSMVTQHFRLGLQSIRVVLLGLVERAQAVLHAQAERL